MLMRRVNNSSEKLMLTAVRILLRRFRKAFLVAKRVSVMPPPE
jgi:hypothetical protein